MRFSGKVLAFSLVLLMSCHGRFYYGIVVDKYYTPQHYSTSYTSRYGFPIPQTSLIGDKYQFKVEYPSIRDGSYRYTYVYVDSTMYHLKDLGDTVVNGKRIREIYIQDDIVYLKQPEPVLFRLQEWWRAKRNYTKDDYYRPKLNDYLNHDKRDDNPQE